MVTNIVTFQSRPRICKKVCRWPFEGSRSECFDVEEDGHCHGSQSPVNGSGYAYAAKCGCSIRQLLPMMPNHLANPNGKVTSLGFIPVSRVRGSERFLPNSQVQTLQGHSRSLNYKVFS
jgi:hypothetical protein